MMKTPDEIKKGLECCADYGNCSAQGCPYNPIKDCGHDLYSDALAYIQQLEAAVPKWISVEDDRPEAGKTVQLLWKRASDKTQSVCGYMLPHSDIAITYRFHILDYNIYVWEDITHWAPLLEPPKEDA